MNINELLPNYEVTLNIYSESNNGLARPSILKSQVNMKSFEIYRNYIKLEDLTIKTKQ